MAAQTFIRCVYIVLLLLLPSLRVGAQEHPTDINVIEEYNDGKGYFVRTIEYHQGGKRIVETIKKAVVPVLLTKPINPDTLLKDSLYVEVTKSKYKVDVYYKKRKIRSYVAVFGPRPLENKRMEGDRCTPEGCYRIKYKNPNSQYHKFMLLDYPNDSALARFNDLKKNGTLPPTAKVGGNVGIHGVWKGGDDLVEMGVGWTDGCVALKNKDVDELFQFLHVGTKVYIKK